MLTLTETAQELALVYPRWTLLISVLGIALFAYVARPKAAIKKRWALITVSGLMICAGIYFGTFKVTLTPEYGRIYVFLSEDTRMDWADATTAAVVTRNRGKGGPKEFMTVVDGSLRELEIPLGGLNADERQRVVAYVYARMPR